MDGSRSEIKSIRSDLDPHKTGEPLAAGGGALDELEAAAVDEAAPPPVDVESHPFDSCRRRCSRGGVLGAAFSGRRALSISLHRRKVIAVSCR